MNDADTQLVQHLDNNTYNDKDLVEVKVALSLPYITATKNFERVDGQLELNGIQYNYVKRKITGDTLYILCLPNFSKTQINNAKRTFAKTSNDIPNAKKDAASSVAKKSGGVNEYTFVNFQLSFAAQILSSAENKFLNTSIVYTFIKPLIQPPDSHC